ncbi:hypothetical protein C8R41DRAFT_839529 [Lentinula lateritia]|uniref:Uncharacterized protein n=1 Tax=Lentinula lateritia TaxID=40482 RepID=A0ABQ8VAT6_9AGAR|nr:hypothetical protein C8R41DRAFT_839529 [Lentinula lateritia]
MKEENSTMRTEPREHKAPCYSHNIHRPFPLSSSSDVWSGTLRCTTCESSERDGRTRRTSKPIHPKHSEFLQPSKRVMRPTYYSKPLKHSKPRNSI